jgi:DNA-binding FrmR family transcriptional regulator
MENAQSRVVGIAQMLEKDRTYEAIRQAMHCSKRNVSQLAKAMRDPNHREGECFQSTQAADQQHIHR